MKAVGMNDKCELTIWIHELILGLRDVKGQGERQALISSKFVETK